MNLKKFISAAVGAAMLFASLPTNGTVVNFAEDTLKANAEDYDTATTTEPYYSTTEPYSYYYGSEDASEAASWIATEASRPWYEDATEVASSEALPEIAGTDAWEETTYPYWLEETTDPNGSYDSSLSADSLAVYFFSSDTNFDKLTEAIKSHQNGTSTVTYTYNGKTVESPKDIFKKGQHKYELGVENRSIAESGNYGGWAEQGKVTIYIGVKGDANLDDKVDSKDAVAVLDTYSYTLLDMNKSLQTDDSLENLANYLADIDTEAFDSDNIRSRDAMYILRFFAMDIAEQNPYWSNICEDLASAGKTYSLDNSDFQINYGDETANTVITVGSVAVKPGTKTVSVPVTISGNAGFAYGGFVFRYDPAINFKNCGEGLIYKPEIANSNNLLATTIAKSEDVKNDGALFTLEFEIPADAKAGKEFKIEPSLDEFGESGGRYVAVKLVTGAIKVSDDVEETTEPKPVENENVTYKHSNDNETVIEVGNVEISKDDPGRIVEVPVAIFNNPGFAGTIIRYIFDNKMTFSSIEGILIESPVKNAIENVVAVTSAESYDLTADSALYYLNFELPKDAKVGDVYNISVEIRQFANADGKDVKAKSYSGSITIVGDSEPLKATVKTNELEVGKKTTIEANQDNLTYSTSDINVAVVSKSGEITAISAGTAIITVINSDGETDQIVMTVKGLSLETTTTVPTTTTTTTTSTKSLGDLNGDGKTDSKDAVIVLKSYAEKLAGNPTKDDTSAGDVNGDGEVDSKDAVIILRYYASVIAGVFKGNISEFK